MMHLLLLVLAVASANNAFASANAALNSFATAGTTCANSSSLTLFATSTAIDNATLFTVDTSDFAELNDIHLIRHVV